MRMPSSTNHRHYIIHFVKEYKKGAMADKYPNFEVLSRNETSGIDFRILVRQAAAAFAIVAPHGGGIEPGTSEIADAIAAEEFSFYAFEGLKSSGNGVLHITST